MKNINLFIATLIALLANSLPVEAGCERQPYVSMPVDGKLKGSSLSADYRSRRGQKIATLSGNYDDDSRMLFDLDIKVEKDFQGKGVSTFLFSEMFKEYPSARTISAGLGGDNLLAFKKARLAGADDLAALRATPFFRSVSKYCFDEIEYLDAECLDLTKNQEDEADCNIIVKLNLSRRD